MRERLIGIDAGGTMTKAALFDMTGRELACERRPNITQFPAKGHTERDPDAMWEAACGAISAVMARTGTLPADVAAISVSGFGSGLFVVDREGNPVRPGIGSTDTRASGFVQEWQATGLADWIAQRTSQRVWAGQSLALLAWLQRHEPDLLARTHSVLMCKDFIRARLCGDLSTDPTDAGITGLLDVRSQTYAADVLDRVGFAGWTEKMPRLRPSCSVAGGVTNAAAARTGLRAGTPVAVGLLDVAASAIASGVTSPAELSIVAGTFSINSTMHLAPRTSTPPFLQCPFPIDGAYLATEGGATSASNFEWFCRHFLLASGFRSVEPGLSTYDQCNALVAAAMGRPNDILFFPFLFGGPRGAPAGLLGLFADHALGDVVRAIYEGIAFAHKHDIAVLLSGPDAARPTSARLAGGASCSAVWAQIFADTIALPMQIMEGSEMGAKGVAMAAAVAIGAYPDLAAAATAMTRPQRLVEPAAARVDELAAKYRRYAAVCDALTAPANQDLRHAN